MRVYVVGSISSLESRVHSHLNRFQALAFVAVVASILACGCGSHPIAQPHQLPVTVRAAQPNLAVLSASTARTSASPVAIVQSSELYHQAQEACKVSHYRHAADLLAKLAKQPGLTADERSFAVQQENLCLKDARLPTVPDKTKASSSTEHSIPNTRYPTTNALPDCGPRALAIVCGQLGVTADAASLSKAAGMTKDGTTLEGLAKAAKSVGLKAEGVQAGREGLTKMNTPALAWFHRNHFVALLSLHGEPGDAGTATIRDPNEKSESTISQEMFLRQSSGYLLLVHH